MGASRGPPAAVGYLVSGLEALPDADEVQAIQPCAPGLLIQFIFHVSSVLGVHVLPATTHDHLRDKGAITPRVLNCSEAPGVPAWKAAKRVWVEVWTIAQPGKAWARVPSRNYLFILERENR